MGFAGILVIAAGEIAGPRTGDDFVLGVVYIVLAAVGVTVGNVVFRRLAGTVDPVMAAGSHLLGGAVPLAVAAAVTESGQSITWSANFVLSLVGLALPGTAAVVSSPSEGSGPAGDGTTGRALADTAGRTRRTRHRASLSPAGRGSGPHAPGPASPGGVTVGRPKVIQSWSPPR